MARDPTLFREQKAEYLSEAVADGEVSEADADRIRELVAAFDETKPTVQRPAWPDAPANLRGPRSESTLANWLYFLARWAKHTELSTASPRQVNQVAEDMLNGDLPEVKDGGLSAGTVRAYQNAVRIFYRYHEDLAVEWSDVSVQSRSNGNGGDSDGRKWGPEDILTREEIDRIQAETTDYRHSAVFNLLLFTGMRNRALRTLRIKDVDVEEGSYRFNPAEGTKDIYEPRARRPLFGAKGPVRDWLQRHPTPDDGDAYLITTDKKFTNPDPTEPVSDNTIGRITNKIKEAAEIDKPMHPHMLRHNFVYIMKRAYEVPDDTIRFYLGHAPDSTIMEQTYSHLGAEDHFQRGRVAAGEVDPSDEDIGFELTTCPDCGFTLEEGMKACPRCANVFTPEARDASDEIQQDVGASKALAELDGDGDVSEADLEEIANDDVILAKLIELRSQD